MVCFGTLRDIDGLGRDPDRGDPDGGATGGAGVAAKVSSVTSWGELARDASAEPHVTRCLRGTRGPVIAATNYVRAGGRAREHPRAGAARPQLHDVGHRRARAQ